MVVYSTKLVESPYILVFANKTADDETKTLSFQFLLTKFPAIRQYTSDLHNYIADDETKILRVQIYSIVK